MRGDYAYDMWYLKAYGYINLLINNVTPPDVIFFRSSNITILALCQIFLKFGLKAYLLNMYAKNSTLS